MLIYLTNQYFIDYSYRVLTFIKAIRLNVALEQKFYKPLGNYSFYDLFILYTKFIL